MKRIMTRSKDHSKPKQATKVYVIFIIIGGMAFLASLFADFSLCIIYNVTGVPCFSCGMTRAFMSLPDIPLAFAYHPLFFTVPLIPFLAFFPEKSRNIASCIFIVVFISVWVIRMLVLFPHTPPMEYNYNALINNFR